MALYQPAHHQIMVSAFGENIRVSCRFPDAWCCGCWGFRSGTAIGEQTQVLANELNHPYSCAMQERTTRSLRFGCARRRKYVSWPRKP